MPGPVMSSSQASRVVLRASAGPTIIVGVVAVIVGAFVSGGGGALGAALGAVLVVIFFATGQYALAVVLERNPQMAMSAALIIYLVKIAILFVLIAAFKNTTLFDPKVFGMTVLACTLVWTGAEVWAMGRTKMLVIEPTRTGGPGGTSP